MSNARKRIAVTAGEPAGIGPDLCLALGTLALPCSLVVLGNRALLEERAQLLQLDVQVLPPGSRGADAAHVPGAIEVIDVPLGAPAVAGKLDPANARHVLALLDRALSGLRNGEFHAMVTAPVQKSVLNDAGIAFTGHTEYLASKFGADEEHAPHPVMLLAAGALRVALATTHLPLRAVPDAITAGLLDTTLRILDEDVRRLWGIARPRIAVCGLNPHAGESGHLGREEGDVIAPAIQRARAAGLLVDGPLPADTVFVPRNVSNYDVVLAMYHDQGLPVLKHAGFGHAVNVTLGLPIVRTSVDHGTALDLAGTGRADAGSLVTATQLAIEFAERAA